MNRGAVLDMPQKRKQRHGRHGLVLTSSVDRAALAYWDTWLDIPREERYVKQGERKGKLLKRLEPLRNRLVDMYYRYANATAIRMACHDGEGAYYVNADDYLSNLHHTLMKCIEAFEAGGNASPTSYIITSMRWQIKTLRNRQYKHYQNRVYLESGCLEATVAEPDYEKEAGRVWRMAVGTSFEELIEALPDVRMKDVLRRRYVLEQTYNQMGADYGLSKQRMKQLHDYALGELAIYYGKIGLFGEEE